jgi:glycosyltransferase involved in cell wall biosynthesis
MKLSGDDITIAITVFDRREFIAQAVASALNQTVPVRVMVVEDCGPDAGLRDFLVGQFGARIEYHRNPRRRGLFDNWNACREYCRTPWLSILHDDDYFKPSFVETMLRLHEATPGRGLYFGSQEVVNERGETLSSGPPAAGGPGREIDLPALAEHNTLGFAGHLFSAAHARACGGFRAASRFCGDWEMWFQLTARWGGVRTDASVAVVRHFEDWRRGTSKVVCRGENFAATNVQRKRNHARLRQAGVGLPFDKTALRANHSMTAQSLLTHGADFSRRMFRYNLGLFLRGHPGTSRQQWLQLLFRGLGPDGVRLLTRMLRVRTGYGS